MNKELYPNSINLLEHSIWEVPYLFYLPEFISENEEKNLLRFIEKAPKTKWTNLKNRTLQNWGGIPGGGKNDMMIEEPLPDWLTQWCNTFNETLFIKTKDDSCELVPFFSKPPNHCLINKYLPGQGIMVGILKVFIFNYFVSLF